VPPEPFTLERCRDHAKACREMARTATPGQRKQLENIAALWEQFCVEFERIEKRKR
jgi:hypothetical protein